MPAVSLAAIQDAARALVGVAVRTPMVRVAGWPLFLKCEHLQPSGAFKIRGAFTAIAALAPADRARGVVTSSSGNHGQAVAAVARRFGIPSVIVMPESAPGIKVAGVRSHGGEVVFAGKTRSPQQQTVAEGFVTSRGMTMIPPFDHAGVITGQGTCGLEIMEQAPGARIVLVPVGGGGLLSGVTTAISALRPDIEIIGVEPAGAPKLSAALAADGPVLLEQTASVADGLLTRSIGVLPWSLIHGRVRRAVQVTEAEIGAAVRWLYHHQGLRVEPSPAVAVAAVLAEKIESDGPIVAVLSGGNVDPDLFQRLIDS